MTWLQGMQAHNGMDKPSLGETWHSRGGIGFDCSMDLGSQVSGLGWTGLGWARQHKHNRAASFNYWSGYLLSLQPSQ